MRKVNWARKQILLEAITHFQMSAVKAREHSQILCLVRFQNQKATDFAGVDSDRKALN